jgi:NADH dehydrogenase
MTENEHPHIVVLGGGFGGLEFCKRFDDQNARITLVDRTNHHLFQPLLYQVATAGKKVVLRETTLSYDYLVLALGSCTSYFGHPEWEEFAPGLKTLQDATRIRSRILRAFEHAESETSAAAQERLMTIVVVGGGPTGVELAGAFSELAQHVLKADFRRIDPAQAQVILLEGAPRILANLSPALSASAQRQLEKLGAHVRTGTKVRTITEGRVELDNGETIHAANIIWAAGVSATPLTKKLGVELDRAGRVKVNPDLSVPAHPEVFAIGDMALVLERDGSLVPGVSPAAMQMGTHVAHIIENEIAFPGGVERPAFKYWDKGTMATIGRSAAVAKIGKFEFSGIMAWLAWLVIHLVFLVGFRNKIAVLFQWFYSYITYKRGARIITSPEAPAPPEK